MEVEKMEELSACEGSGGLGGRIAYDIRKAVEMAALSYIEVFVHFGYINQLKVKTIRFTIQLLLR